MPRRVPTDHMTRYNSVNGGIRHVVRSTAATAYERGSGLAGFGSPRRIWWRCSTACSRAGISSPPSTGSRRSRSTHDHCLIAVGASIGAAAVVGYLCAQAGAQHGGAGHRDGRCAWAARREVCGSRSSTRGRRRTYPDEVPNHLSTSLIDGIRELVKNPFPNVPLPAGACTVAEWADVDSDRNQMVINP
jgi:hypothetical protein